MLEICINALLRQPIFIHYSRRGKAQFALYNEVLLASDMRDCKKEKRLSISRSKRKRLERERAEINLRPPTRPIEARPEIRDASAKSEIMIYESLGSPRTPYQSPHIAYPLSSSSFPLYLFSIALIVIFQRSLPLLLPLIPTFSELHVLRPLPYMIFCAKAPGSS